LFIGNISFDSTEEYIRESFGECGEIREIRIPLHPDTQRQKGYVFVEFAERKGAEKALKWNKTFLDGKRLKIERTTLKTL
jgi:RNA recognition motif-containing protein